MASTPPTTPPRSNPSLCHTSSTPHTPHPDSPRKRKPPRIRALLIDISGTLLVSHTPLPNASQSLTRLRHSHPHIPFRLCTNTSKESHASLVKRLIDAGFGEQETLEGEVWSSIGALRGVMNALNVRRPYMILSPSAMEECMLAIPNTNTNTNTDADVDSNKDIGADVHHPAAPTPPRSTDLPTTSESTTSPPRALSSSTSPRIPTDPPPSPSPSRAHARSPTSPASPQRSHDAVIVGLAPSMLDYDHLNTAFRILIGESQLEGSEASTSTSSSTSPSTSPSSTSTRTGTHARPPLIALHKARYFASSEHSSSDDKSYQDVGQQLLSLGPGPFVTALEEATNTKAIVIGKPSKAFFEGCLSDLFPDDKRGDNETQDENDSKDDENDLNGGMSHTRWEDVAVIGDDVLTDLGEGAIELGLWRVLVKTGKYRPGDECRPGVVPPDQVCDSFPAFVDWLLGEPLNVTRGNSDEERDSGTVAGS